MLHDSLNNFIINNNSNRNELNNIFNRYQRLKEIRYCMMQDYEKKCSKKIICAHSISKSTLLKNISCNIKGKDVVGCFQKTNPLNFTPLFQRIRDKYIDINSSLTFTGLCSYHDNFLFQNIDKDPFNFNKPQIVFEYTLRNCIYSYYNRFSNEQGIFASYSFLKSKLFRFSSDSNLGLNSISSDKNIISKDMDILCSNLYSENKYKNILYKIITYEGNLNIAGNMFVIYQEEAYYITILPGLQRSYVLITAIKGENIMEKNHFFELIRSLEPNEFEILLSGALLQATSINNFVFNYNKFQSLDEDTKTSIYDWLDYENMDKVYNNNIRYKELGEVPNIIQLMLD